MGDDPVQIKFECKEVDPCENSRAVHISPHSSRTVIDSEKVQPRRIESRTWTFQRAINQGRASPLTSPKWVEIRKFAVFGINFDKKKH